MWVQTDFICKHHLKVLNINFMKIRLQAAGNTTALINKRIQRPTVNGSALL